MRTKVLAVVDELGYKVNFQARQLAVRRPSVIGMVHASDFDSEPNSYFSSALELGATRAAVRLGMGLQPHVINQNDPNAANAILDLVRPGDCEDLILTPPFTDDIHLLRELMNRGCRVVGIASGPEAQTIIRTVGIDDWQAGYDIGVYLRKLGHTDFGFILGLESHASASQRYEGFLSALSECGLPERNVRTARGAFTFKSGLQCADALLERKGSMTALVCANDDMAAGALLAAHRRHLRIPEDFAITGFDDTPVSEIIWPPLTTIHQPLRQIAEKAVEILADSGEEEPGKEVIDHHLVVRETSEIPN